MKFEITDGVTMDTGAAKQTKTTNDEPIPFRLYVFPTCPMCGREHQPMHFYAAGYTSPAFCPVVLAQKLAELVPEAVMPEKENS